MSEEQAAAQQQPPPSEDAKPPLQAGDIVADKYRVDEIVGQGAMGFVFAAEHTHLGHRVALKVLRAGALEHKESVERFLREGRIVARIQSEHVARVSDVGTLKSGVPYLVMEFLEGSDLSKILKQRGEPLSLPDAVDFTLQVCEALAHAHALGVVHRDLKPANLYVTTRLDGSPLLKVLDFGISKSSTYGEGQDELTMTAALMGTPRYMSPEQIHDSRLVDSRTDIWALGTIIYEMLTLERCFQAPSVAMTCVKILQQEPTQLSQLRPDLPPAIEEIVGRCLRKEPNDRYLHVGELAEAIAPFGPQDAAATAARITRIATTPHDGKHGARAVLGATGSFTASGSYSSLSGSGSNPSAANALRITGTGSGSVMVSASPGASPASASSQSGSNSGAIAGGTVAPEVEQRRRGKVLIYGGVAAVAIVVAIVLLSRGGKQPEGVSPASTGAPPPTVSAQASASSAESATTLAATATASAAPNASATASASASASATATTTSPVRRWTPPANTKPTATTTAAPTVTTPPKPTSTGGDNVLDDRR